MVRFALALFAWIVCAVPLLAAEPDPSDLVRILEEGPRSDWDAAAQRLVRYKEEYKRYVLDPRSLGSLLKRWAAFSPDTRVLIAKGMQRNTSVRTPETVMVFVRLLEDPETRIREEAFQILIKNGTSATAPALARYTPATADDRIKLIRHLVRVNDTEQAEKRERPASSTFTEASAGVRDELFSVLVPFFADSSPQVRIFLAERVERFIDERVNDLLFRLRVDPATGLQALLTLATRGDVRACGPLLEWAEHRFSAALGQHTDTGANQDNPNTSDSPDERAKRFSRVGEVCGSLQPAYFIDLYRQATSQDDRRDRMHLLLNIPVKPFDRLVSTELRRALNEAATETDPELRHWASVQLATLASYESEQGLQRKKAEQDVVRWRYALAGALIAASVLGIFIFLWGFRMLQLRRLLQHLAPASARTVTLGLTSLRGEVQPYDGRMLVHPVTEE
ncbi:MAG: hypothetical protein AB7P69_17965, partial [Candidatus Binatia bacterium]